MTIGYLDIFPTGASSGTLKVANGGTGQSSLANHGVLIGEGTNPINSIPLTNGQLLIGSTGNDPIPNILAAGTGITITNGSGSIMISASGGTGMSWTDEFASFAAMSNNGYFVQAGTSTVVGTLPPNPSQGDTIIVQCLTISSPGMVILQANAGQSIFFGTTFSSVGGSITSVIGGNSVTMTYRTVNSTWHTRAAQGSWAVS